MIFQGLLNISSIYLDNEDFLFNQLDHYFHEKINEFNTTHSCSDEDLRNQFTELIEYIKTELISLGFDKQSIEYLFLDPFVNLTSSDIDEKCTIHQIYDLKVAPILYELFLEKIVEYLVDIGNVNLIMLNLKASNFLSLELIVELKNLKDIINNNPKKKENLKKYIQIHKKFETKLLQSKIKIEMLEDLPDPKEKLQLLYLTYRIISVFHLEKKFDFSHIIQYISDNMNEWLVTVPLVTLKNPDLYFCGLYLSAALGIKLDEEKVKKFLLELYEEGIDEFEAPLVQATDGVYYLLKATNYMKLWLSDLQLNRLIETDPEYFEPSYLKTLETSQLVVILKIYNLIRARNVEEYVNAILEELEHRITPEGIKQYRDGFITSEATYYVLFCNYMRNTLDKLRDYNLLESTMSIIYRNLELLELSEDTNFDLISELLYAFEILKLFNCIETRQMIIKMAEYLFPPEVAEKISVSPELLKTQTRFRHLKVNKITGETMY
ncbi:MAG: hypothetical protein ACFE96_08115 [Candidatus Hermodarchaeota archaeon]